MEEHFGRIKLAIEESDLSEPLKASVLAAISSMTTSEWVSLSSTYPRNRQSRPLAGPFLFGKGIRR